ncbi:MAG: MFS transporter [Verrucomicrobiota bacterium]
MQANSWHHGVTRYQWLVLFVAWLGWVFDSIALLLLPFLGYFNNGIFSGFPIYLPELYPTRLRATGAGFCFNVGRVLASAGPFLTGFLVTALGGFGRAASAIALIYLVGLLILPFAPETKGQPLPE